MISDEVDVAIGRVLGVEQVLGIRPMGRYPLAGEDLLVVEYSRSTAIDETPGNLGFADPEVWKGYVVRSYRSDMPPIRAPRTATNCLFQPFPAPAVRPALGLSDLLAMGEAVVPEEGVRILSPFSGHLTSPRWYECGCRPRWGR